MKRDIERERERDLTGKVIRESKRLKTEGSVKETDRKLVSGPYQCKEEVPLIRRVEDQKMCWLVETKPTTICV